MHRRDRNEDEHIDYMNGSRFFGLMNKVEGDDSLNYCDFNVLT